MTHNMSFRRYTRIFYMVMMLLMGGAGEVWAEITTSEIIIDDAITNGSVTAKSTESVAGGTKVTITVKPDNGYYVNKSDIIVEKLVAPSAAQSRRRAPGIANALAVTGPSRSSVATDYTFIVPTDYAGALVTVSFTAKTPATATVTANFLTYTGEAQELVTLKSVVGGAATNPVTYSLSSGGTYSATIPTGTDAGTYTVYYKVAGDAIHTDGSGSVTLTIDKARITSVVLANNAINHDGNQHTFDVNSVKAGTLVVPSENYEVSDNTATAVGTYTVTVTAKSGSTNFTGSATASFRIVETTTKIIYSNTPASEISGLNGHYLLMDNISASVLANLYDTDNDFTGTFEVGSDNDGNFYKIDMTDYGHALFNTVNGGTVKNVMLNSVNISSGTNVGAIAGVASGYTRIYNCGVLGGSVGGSGYVGGLVGWLKDDSRVINCFSYARCKLVALMWEVLLVTTIMHQKVVTSARW